MHIVYKIRLTILQLIFVAIFIVLLRVRFQLTVEPTLGACYRNHTKLEINKLAIIYIRLIGAKFQTSGAKSIQLAFQHFNQMCRWSTNKSNLSLFRRSSNRAARYSDCKYKCLPFYTVT